MTEQRAVHLPTCTQSCKVFEGISILKRSAQLNNQENVNLCSEYVNVSVNLCSEYVIGIILGI